MNIKLILYTNNYIYNTIDNISNNDNFGRDLKFHYHYVIFLLRTYSFKDRRKTFTDYAPINVRILRRLISHDHVKQILENLVSAGLIETDGVFIKGTKKVIGKSRGYRLTEKALSEKFYIIENKDLKLVNRIEKAYNKMHMKYVSDKEGYSYVTACMEDLKIDSIQSLNYIENNVSDTPKKESHVMSVELFDLKFVVVDRTGNRLHNNLTNLHTPLRQFLSYNGHKLVQCDIRNSQLVFLAALMKNYNIPEQEMQLFNYVVCEYGFYEFFAEKLDVPLTKKNRKEFKEFVFKDVLFSSNKSMLSAIENKFKEIFPTIFYIIRRIKTENYKNLSIMLQREESNFIFKCVEKIGKEIPLFTIHDSIGTIEGQDSKILDVMQEEFKIQLNLFPNITVEKF